MAKITKNGPQPIKPATSNVSTTSNRVSKRSVADLLPVVNQTETLTKFFNATVDHMFQPENVEFINGYIGSKPSYYDNTRDFYISESTKTRENYQLPVTAVSVDSLSNTTNNVMFYDDIVNQLEIQGSNISTPSRLFESEYYSWLPPINPDKFINFYEYYWLPNGPGTIQLLDPTNLQVDAVGKTEFTYTGTYYRLADNTTITGDLKFSSGMKITTSYDQDPTLNNVYLLVEEVGTSIKIEPDYMSPNPGWDIPRWNIRGWDGDSDNILPDYMTLGRMSKNYNRYSVNNRWFHKDVIIASGMRVFDIESNKALRPIIEFDSNMKLYNHGTFGRADVDIVDTITKDVFAEIAGKSIGKVPIGGTTVVGYNVHIAGTNIRVGSGNGFVATGSANAGDVGTNPTPYDGHDAVVYASTITLDGVNLIDGMTILFTADRDPTVNNRIYRVGGIQEYGVITLTLLTDGQDETGAPAYGDCTYSVIGSNNGKKSWWYNGTNWIEGQQRTKFKTPLFEGFDMHGNMLRDPSVYPGSNFAGTSIFTYAVDTNQPTDTQLGLQAKRDQFGFYIFENTLATKTYTYTENGIQRNYNGYIWYSNGNIGNNWHKSRGASRQYILNNFNITEPSTTFLIDQTPAPNVVGYLPTIKVILLQNGNSKLLIKDVDYTVNNRTITLKEPAPTDSRLEIHSWNPKPPSTSNGYYQLPVNLIGNPNNDQPSTVNFNQLIKHFSGLISNQFQETTNGVGSTSWRDSAKILGLGTDILQHRSPLLKLMMLNSNNINIGPLANISQTDPSLVIQWAQHEYIRFYNRFLRVLFNLSKQGYDDRVSAQTWIDSALRQLNIGKSKSNSWAYSGYEQTEDFTSTTTPTFVPPTAARLGMSPVYHPLVYLDNNYYPPKITIQTHDGSRLVMEDLDGILLGTIKNGSQQTINPDHLTDPVAGAWLQLELNIYNGIPAAYKDVDAQLSFDQRVYKPGKWRNKANLVDYTYDEYINILRPSFDKWVIITQVDYSANTTYQENNQFSFNYSSCSDNDGDPIPGHWRGIYRWFYDTDRPHSHPWEMLGFSQKPDWWDTTYGTAPYTRGNTTLWEDLRDGVIREGARAGTYAEWARPGLLDCIPVDEQGMLLPPNLAGTVSGLPDSKGAMSEWKLGDVGPIENVWLHSLENSYITALTSYLMKPARFIEQTWDPLRTVQVGEGDNNQSLYINTNRRRSSAEFYFHRENPLSITSTISIPNESTLTFFGSWGFQHWVAEYLTYQNLSVTTYAGKIIRGAYSSLAHKFGGFIGTDNSLRVMVDSFGQLGYTSQLVPSENIKTYLYQSSSLGTYFYSGIIVVKQSNGWKVYGYDGIKSTFTIIPSIATGPKSTKVIGKITVTEYKNGAGLETVTYGTIFTSIQDVFDFIISYGRWLESQGWEFDNVNENNNKVSNWRQAARDFVFWSQGKWTSGNFIAISPGADLIKFKKDFGTIQYVSGTVGGTYPVLDKQGQPIEAKDIEVLRYNNELTVSATNEQAIYGMRLYITTVEHIMLIDNLTQFNDLIYDPLYSIYQPRLKMYGYRTNGWTGRLDAPGYFLYQDPTTNQWKMIENFEKTSENSKNLFNIDQPKNIWEIDNTSGLLVEKTSKNHVVTRSDLADLSKHTLGFQRRDYLDNLLLDDTTQFEFYQGFIRQKGSIKSLDGMLRNSNILGFGEKINYYEEYAFRKSRYGSVSLNTNIDFIIPQVEAVNNPQRIDVFSQYDSSQSRDNVIEISARDPHIVVPPEAYDDKLFPLRTSVNNILYRDLPTSGYVLLGESNYNVLDQEELFLLNATLEETNRELVAGNVIWQYITPSASWDIWKVVDASSTVKGTIPQYTTETTAIMFNYAHGIVVGDIVVISGFTANSTLNGTFTVSDVNETMIYVPVPTYIEDINGVVRILKSKRFYSKSDLDDWTLTNNWDQGDLAYVDNGIKHGQWTVYRWNVGSWEVYRKAEPKVDAELILSSRLYNKVTFNDIKTLEYYDPCKGLIPGVVDKEISYKTVYDPAQYNKGDTTTYSLNPDEAWTEPHVGEVWWDLSTTRYVDYENGPIDYRVKNWGKLAPNTTIDIYEWTKSTIPPSQWAIAVSDGTTITRNGITITPSGTVRNASNPVWTERTEYDQYGNSRLWYYFWVGKSNMAPVTAGRSLTTNEIAKIILDPATNSIAWYAIISERSLIVSNINHLLDNNNIVMQINYTSKPNNDNDYKEWTIIRKDDPSSYIDPEYWQKLRDSLSGFDSLGNNVPDIWLNDLQKFGNLVRPRQSWFKNRFAALGIFISKVNSQIKSATTPLILDSSKTTWRLWFEQSEPLPPARGNYEYKINDISELELIRANAVDGERALVMPSISTENMWTIWAWSAVDNDFILNRKQSYKVQNYWDYIDWYAAGYDSKVIADYTVDTIENRDELTITSKTVVKVLDYGALGWALFEANFENGSKVWNLIGLQDGTIKINDNLWKTDLNLTGFDQKSLDANPFDYNPTIEIGLIFDGIIHGIYGDSGRSELNQLFFTMINYVFSEQRYVDWVFKTSFICMNGSMEKLNSSELYKPNTVDLLLDYVNETKPYRSKVREFVSSRVAFDESSIKRTTDFDKPPYDDPASDSIRILSELTMADQNIMIETHNVNVLATSNTFDYTPWFYNYKTNPQLIRRLKTQLVFDRVSSMPKFASVINASANGSTVVFNVKPSNQVKSFKVREKIYVTNVYPISNSVTMFNSSNVVILSASGNVVVAKYDHNLEINTGKFGNLYHHYTQSLPIISAHSSGNVATFTMNVSTYGNTFRIGEVVSISDVNVGISTNSFTTTTAVVIDKSMDNVTVSYTDSIGIATGVGGNIFHQYSTFMPIIKVESSGDIATFTMNGRVTNIFVEGETVSVGGNIIANQTLVDSFTTLNGTVKSISGNLIVVGYDRPVGIGTGIGGAIYHGVEGAADRVVRYYAPSTFMPDPFSPDLIAGTDYSGTIYTGGNLNWEPGWGVAPWGFQAGWAAESEFEALYEVLLEGGMPIVYDTFYGDGSRTLYKLNKVAQDWYGSKIWVDKKILSYGIDFTTPNYADRLIVSLAGSGYSAGDKLKLVEDTPHPESVTPEFTVDTVSASGGIRKITLTNPGYFDIVQYDSYHVEYADTYNIGNGKGAKIQPVWGGNTVKFTTPPSSSDKINIHILYSGTTFNPAPAGEYDTIIDNNTFIQPNIEADHAEELFTGRLADAIRIDTYTNPLSGMPYVFQKSYITYGDTDHYDIGLRPQDESAVTVYLEDKILRYGPTFDYVVNFETGQLVFVKPPEPNKWLTIIAVGEGGSGNTLASAYPVNRGVGYLPGDRITLEGGVPVPYGTTGAKQRGTVKVETVTGVQLLIVNPGKGYKTNEILQLSNNTVPEENVINKLLIKLTKVSRTGGVITAEILSPGSYKEVPTENTWITANASASELDIQPVWGIDTLSIYQRGLYSERPNGPFTQYSASQTSGLDATFNASFTSIIDEETFVADGESTVFNLKQPVGENSNFFIVVNGKIATIVERTTSSFTLSNPPPFGSFIVATIFNTSQYSIVQTEDIIITGEQPVYYLQRSAANTIPSYSTLEVSVAGAIIPPPKMYLATGDGATFQFDLESVPPNLANLKVYINGEYQTIYTVTDKRVTFNSPPPVDSTVVFVIIEAKMTPVYLLTSDGGFEFYNLAEGTKVTIKTFTQDLSYRFATDTFYGNPSREYELQGLPSSETTISVLVNGVPQRMLWDYGILKRTKLGYDIFGYEAQPFDWGPLRYYIKFGEESNPGPNDTVVVRYMRGIGERPRHAFRQFIDIGMYRQSQVLTTDAKTVLLTDVYVNSSNLYVSDGSALTEPTITVPGSMWINNEKIDFLEMYERPTKEFPKRALITGLVRGSGGTCWSPEIVDNCIFYDGNNSKTIFATPSGFPTNGISVFVNNKFQAGGSVTFHTMTGNNYSITIPQTVTNIDTMRVYLIDVSNNNTTSLLVYNLDYTLTLGNIINFTNLIAANNIIRVEIDIVPGRHSNYYLGQMDSYVASKYNETTGWYIIFDLDSIPPIGWRNIKFVTRSESSTTICHYQGTIVQDAGSKSIIPGGYAWEAAPQGLQMNTSPLANFLNEHPGAPD